MSDRTDDEHVDDTEVAVAAAMRRVTAASDAMTAAKRGFPDAETATARGELSSAVGAARNLDVSWQTIGDAIGMRRGAAYQRFRRRPPSRHLEIHEAPIDGVTVLAVSGELDADTSPRMVEAINDALLHVPMGLIVDLVGVRSLSSAGMTALVDGNRAARRSEKRFGVVVDGAITIRPLKMMGIDRKLNLYPTVHAAMRGLHQLADRDEAGS